SPFQLPPLTFYFNCAHAHLDLHSFPTRRSSDLLRKRPRRIGRHSGLAAGIAEIVDEDAALSRFLGHGGEVAVRAALPRHHGQERDRKSTRLNSSHRTISYAVFCLKKKKTNRKYI